MQAVAGKASRPLSVCMIALHAGEPPLDDGPLQRRWYLLEKRVEASKSTEGGRRDGWDNREGLYLPAPERAGEAVSHACEEGKREYTTFPVNGRQP